MKKLLLIGSILVLAWLAGALFPGAAFLAGDDPMPTIGAEKFAIEESMSHRRNFLTASLNSFDETGRPEQTGKGSTRKRRVTPEHFRRIPAPSANACVSCHYLPYAGDKVDPDRNS